MLAMRVKAKTTKTRRSSCIGDLSSGDKGQLASLETEPHSQHLAKLGIRQAGIRSDR